MLFSKIRTCSTYNTIVRSCYPEEKVLTKYFSLFFGFLLSLSIIYSFFITSAFTQDISTLTDQTEKDWCLINSELTETTHSPLPFQHGRETTDPIATTPLAKEAQATSKLSKEEYQEDRLNEQSQKDTATRSSITVQTTIDPNITVQTTMDPNVDVQTTMDPNVGVQTTANPLTLDPFTLNEENGEKENRAVVHPMTFPTRKTLAPSCEISRQIHTTKTEHAHEMVQTSLNETANTHEDETIIHALFEEFYGPNGTLNDPLNYATHYLHKEGDGTYIENTLYSPLTTIGILAGCALVYYELTKKE